jgi:hypothetical protein
MSWHVEPKVLQAYAGGTVDDAHAYSIEAHILECGVCRELLGKQVDGDRLEAMWTEIVDVVALPRAGVVERVLLRMGVKDHVARLLTATPSLRLSWFAGIALALGFAIAAAYTNDRGFVIFLVMAPMLPLAGIAVAYGPGVDPTYEIGLAAPMRSFHLLMVRATAVLATSGAMALVASIALAPPGWALVAWLLPAFGLALTSLALATVISPMRSAVSVSIMWMFGCSAAVMSAVRSPATLQDVFGGVQLIVAVVALMGGALLYARRDMFEGGGRR